MTTASQTDGSGPSKCIECDAAISPTTKFCTLCGASQAATPISASGYQESPLDPARYRYTRDPGAYISRDDPRKESRGERRSSEEGVPTGIGNATSTTSTFLGKLRVRYQDAYAVARGLVATGKIIKIAGLVVGGILLLVGLIYFFRDVGMTGAIEGVLFILTGTLAAGGCFIAGTLIAAMGQFMIAAIDIAVNTSKSISSEEMAGILGL